MTPHDHLHRLAAIAQAGVPIPAELGRVLAEASALANADPCKSVDACLIRGAREARNAHLRQAARLVSCNGTALSERATRLAKACNRFESAAWPRTRDLPEPPGRSSELDKALWRARQCGRINLSSKSMIRLIGAWT